jgi:peptidyl-tRNA hydrolase
LDNEAKVDLSISFIYLVNQDLNMSAGKIASQVSHVAMQIGYSDGFEDGINAIFKDDYYPILGRAVVLYASESLLQELIHSPILEIYNPKFVFDSGKTEVPAHSLTCVGFIRKSDELIEDTKNLKSVK